jgi:type VI secretion system secreted protein VgrG
MPSGSQSMSSSLSQATRPGKLTTPLGADVLDLERFEGFEGQSELFEYRIDAVSERENIDFNAALGRNCCVSLKSYGVTRHFNGVLVEAQWVGMQHDLHQYRLVLRPWLWLLSHKANCRIFAKKTIPEILKDVFTKAGFRDINDKLSETYPSVEFTVQYRETDLAFVSRLMEYYGIYYFFEHTEDKHFLVLADAMSCHDMVSNSEGGKIPYIPLALRELRNKEYFHHWMSERRFRTGKVVVDDYDYLQPKAGHLLAQQERAGGYEHDKLEVYDYLGKYPRKDSDTKKKTSDGDLFAKVRVEAEQALDRRRFASGDAANLFPGGMITVQQHKTDDGDYLVVRCSHSFSMQMYRSGLAQDANEAYSGQYELQSRSKPFRAPLVTPKPVIHGPQTATVVNKEGAPGEEIEVDEHGRILIQFHWDRENKPSRRVRVAQIWSGKKWGGQHIPRVGQEVVVEFIEGDPDRPLVVGTVYNEDYRYPYDMPGKKTQSGVKSDSSKGGNGNAWNEWRFEDLKDKEEVYMRAEKDYELLVRNTEKREIGENFKADKMGPVSRSAELVKGDDKLVVAQGHQVVDVKQTIDIKAGIKITLHVGQSSITIEETTITVKAPNIKINGVTTEVTGAGTLTLKGGQVLIN